MLSIHFIFGGPICLYETNTKIIFATDTPMVQKGAGKSSTLWHVYWDDFYSIFWSSHWLFILDWHQSGIIIETIIGWHEVSVSIVYWLVGLHFIGAIYHWFKNDGVWQAMVPILKARKMIFN